MLQIHAVESMPFAENSYIVWRTGRAEAFVIDPGFEPQSILDFLTQNKLVLAAIVNTHGHVDHIAGNGAMKQAYPEAPIIIGEHEADFLTDAEINMSAKYGFEVLSPPADKLVKDGETITVAGIELDVREIPGHSPGHVVYVVHEMAPKWVLGGDVLFEGSVGRTDFPGGSFATLKAGIIAKLWPLPDDTIVFPGHGQPTTTGREKRMNAYVGVDA